jgi:sulfur-oxidizing protein SoxA
VPAPCVAALAVLATIAACMASGEPRSGYDYLGPENRALQDDAFANPGMLWVERGAQAFHAAAGDAPACSACHDAAAMRGVATRYPLVADDGALLNLEGRINRCRVRHQRHPPLPYESDALLALTTWLAAQSRGMRVAVAVDARSAPFHARGRQLYETRLGQLGLACRHCHERNAGRRLRGETISEGMLNGYPAYRQAWQSLGSTHRLFRWCNEAVRAQPWEAGSPEYLALELYVAARGNGLRIEAPAVRR